MKLAIDTNRYSDLARGDVTALELIEGAEEIFVPFAVLAELRTGFVGGSRGKENEKNLQAFLRQPRTWTLFPDDLTTRHYASLALQLRRQGTPIPINDIWIAALAVQHDLTLYARDAHFDHIPQLRRL